VRSGLHSHAPVARRWLRQLVSGLVALPLSALPFVAYVNLTPEGRLVRDRALVALRPPTLPSLTRAELVAATAAAPQYGGKVMALAYHGIGSASDGDGGFIVSPDRFGEHLATLRAAGMHTVTARQVAQAFDGGRPLPRNAVMISFDDGRTDAMMFADPLLAEAHMAATMFVITGAAAEPGIYYASWDKLEGYAHSGRWDLQAHTDRLHRERKAAGGQVLPALTSLEPGESLAEYRARVRADLGRASAAIEDHTGHAPVAFAYPFGAYGAERTNDPQVRSVLREEVTQRYAVAFHQDGQATIPLAGSDDDRLGLRRLEVGDWSGLQLIKRIRAAADRTPGLEHPAPVTPEPDEVDGGQEPAGEPVAAPDTPGSTTSAAPVTTPPPAKRRAPSVPSVTGPAGAPPSTAVPTTGGTSPPSTAPVAGGPTPSTTLPPTTAPPIVTTTTTPATTTTIPPTTTTTDARGCRSHGQGGVCTPR